MQKFYEILKFIFEEIGGKVFFIMFICTVLSLILLIGIFKENIVLRNQKEITCKEITCKVFDRAEECKKKGGEYRMYFSIVKEQYVEYCEIIQNIDL